MEEGRRDSHLRVPKKKKKGTDRPRGCMYVCMYIYKFESNGIEWAYAFHSFIGFTLEFLEERGGEGRRDGHGTRGGWVSGCEWFGLD